MAMVTAWVRSLAPSLERMKANYANSAPSDYHKLPVLDAKTPKGSRGSHVAKKYSVIRVERSLLLTTYGFASLMMPMKQMRKTH